jgi:hypothetical protein
VDKVPVRGFPARAATGWGNIRRGGRKDEEQELKFQIPNPNSQIPNWDFGFRVSGFGFRVSDFGFRISDFGFRISGFGFPLPFFLLPLLVRSQEDFGAVGKQLVWLF